MPALYFNLLQRTIFLSERKKEKNKAITHLQSHPIYQVSPFMQTSTKAILQPSQDIAMLFYPLGEPSHLPLSYPFCSCRAYLLSDLVHTGSDMVRIALRGLYYWYTGTINSLSSNIQVYTYSDLSILGNSIPTECYLC